MAKCRIFLLILLSFTWTISSDAQSKKMQIYGFFDMEAEVSNKDDASKNWTFDQHHFNILANYSLDEKFLVSTEVEWEHGPSHFPEKVSGNIYLAKAYLEYKHSDAFSLRLGKFLSPFGLYNERHDATPTFLFTFLPSSIYGAKDLANGKEGRYYAKQATGIQALGNLYYKDWELRYQVYVSNGRGPDPASVDNNSNKGIGWRFVLTPSISNLRIGTSFYSDKNGDVYSAQQTTFGFDLEYDYSDFHIEAEYFVPKIEKVDLDGITNGTYRNVVGYYVLGAYTIFNRLTPFAIYEYFNPDVDIIRNEENVITFGVNVAVISSVFLKAEVYLHRFQDDSTNNYELFVTSIAVAF